MRKNHFLTFLFFLFALSACSSKILKAPGSDSVLRVDAYEEKVHVKKIDSSTIATTTPATETPVGQPVEKKESSTAQPSPQIKKDLKGKKAEPQTPAKVLSTKAHEPALEDGEGFVGRRPVMDPFRVGERATFSVSYFNVVAGTMDFEVLPFVEVNGRKAYHFQVALKSNTFFSRIYSVDDKAVTYVDYENMVPHSLQITLKETKQLAETRTFFDWKTNKANYWQKKVTSKGESSKELSWEIPNFSQNVVSVIFYIRNFAWREGKTYAVRVADEGKNTVYRSEVVRREKIETDAGTFNTVVIRPQVQVDGAFQPVGDILIWLTDDDRKIIVRIESKIKIGTLVAKLKSLDKGLGQ